MSNRTEVAPDMLSAARAIVKALEAHEAGILISFSSLASVAESLLEEVRYSANAAVLDGLSEEPPTPAGLPWRVLPEAERNLFRRLATQHGLTFGRNGYPQPRCRLDHLVTEDRKAVADPFTGAYYTMLKRPLQVRYGLTYEQVLHMFGLTAAQLPATAPAYSAAKAKEAKKRGLGRDVPRTSGKASPRRARARAA